VKTLVVGGAGFVGSNLVRALLERGHEVLVIDNLLSAERENVPEGAAFIEASINDDDVLASLPEDLDWAFNLVTYHGNQSSIADPLADHEHNLLTSLKLFMRLSEIDHLQKVVYAGAGCTVAEKTFEAASATQEDAPVSLYLDSPYQISKVVGELYGNYFWMRKGLPLVKARFQNVYGPGEVLGAGRWRGTVNTVWRNVTPTFVWKALHDEPLPLDNGGIATRDFIYVEDMARGLIACAEKGEPGGVYNLASGVETSIRELAETIVELVGSGSVEIAPARDWDRSGKRFGATEKSERELGFRATTPLREGLERQIAWTRANEAWIASCIAKHDEQMAAAAAAA
jgi:UDP-glucose 4-epimerase